MAELIRMPEIEIKRSNTHILERTQTTPKGVTYDEYLPDSPRGNTLIISPGFGETKRNFKEGAIEIASNQTHVVVFDRPRYRFRAIDVELAGLPKESVRGSLILENVKQAVRDHNPKVTEFDVFGVSQGGIGLAINKLHHPTTIRKAIYNSPVHFLTDSLPTLSKNFLVMAKDEILNRVRTRDWQGFVRDTQNTVLYWRNPVRSIFEAKDVARTNLSTMPELFKDSTVIITKQDQISAYDALISILQDLGIKDIYELEGGHGGTFDETYWNIILQSLPDST